MKVSNSSKRLQELMDKRNLKQSDIVEKTGFPKSAVSMYLSGKREPRQDKLTILADAFKVNETWLMGYDVPMDSSYNINELTREEILEYCKMTGKSMVETVFTISTNDIQLFNIYKKINLDLNKLNLDGINKASIFIEDLTYNTKYAKKINKNILNAAHKIDGATDEEIKHDDDIMSDENF